MTELNGTDIVVGLPWWLSGKESAAVQETWETFNPWVTKIPWRRKWLPTPVFLLGEFHVQRSLAGGRPQPTGVAKSQTNPSDKHTHILETQLGSWRRFK